MFRLRLNARDDQKQSRLIVLEGRIGFSRLTGGLLPKSQMFVSSRGDELISGRPGGSTLIETETLRSQNVRPSNGLAVVGAEFSPDGARIALNLLDPQQKKNAIVLTDSKLGGIQPLPAGTQFLRWLGKDEILLKSSDRLIRHRLVTGEDHIFDPPPGGFGPAVSGSVIPGTNIQYLVNASGQVGVQKGSQPLQELLQGTKATRFGAIANDLTLFGGVDGEKRLWVQHGLDAKPEVVASGVEAVLWGPISRRAVVLEANNRSRVYDGRDDSWIDLGRVSGGQWSPDEERLLFVEEGYLSLLVEHRIEKLCDLSRTGPVARAVISAEGDKAFLLAGIGGGLNVWMIALPPRAPPQKK
jgi:dipeptidyl aminopeptidase/acylaminoacyl peptidase